MVIGGKRKPLGKKDINIKPKRQKRVLSIKNSLNNIIVSEQFTNDIATGQKVEKSFESKSSGHYSVSPSESLKLLKLQDISLGKAAEITHLDKNSLKHLQTTIFENEEVSSCSHFLCSDENRRSIDWFRLWFLFELEMTYDGIMNLRNGCYENHVYKSIDNNWNTANCLDMEVPKNLKPMPINYLKIYEINSLNDSIPRDIQDVSVDIHSIIENSSPISKGFRKLPGSSLALRYKSSIFDSVKLNAKKILDDSNQKEDDQDDSNSTELRTNRDKQTSKEQPLKLSYFK